MSDRQVSGPTKFRPAPATRGGPPRQASAGEDSTFAVKPPPAPPHGDSPRRLYKATYVPGYTQETTDSPPTQPVEVKVEEEFDPAPTIPDTLPFTRIAMILRGLPPIPKIALTSLSIKDNGSGLAGETAVSIMDEIDSLRLAETAPDVHRRLEELARRGRSQIAQVLAYAEDDLTAGIANVPPDADDAEELKAWSDGLRSALSAIRNSGLDVQPIGVLYLERLDFLPTTVSRGEFLSSVPIAPNESSYVTTKVWSTTTREFEKLVTDSFEGYSETGVSEKSDISQSTESQSRHDVNRDVSLQADATFPIVTVAGKAGLQVNDSKTTGAKSSIQHSMDLTRKASSRSKRDRKLSVKVTETQGTSTQTGQRFYNPDPINPIRVDYYELLKHWEVRLVRFGARMVFDAVLPQPGAELLRQHVEAAVLQDILAEPFVFGLSPSSLDAVTADKYAAQFSVALSPPPEQYKYLTYPFVLPASADTAILPIDIPCPEGYVFDGAIPAHWELARIPEPAKIVG